MRSAPLVNAVGSYRVARAKASAWSRATMLIALIPEVAAVAAVERWIFFARWAHLRNTHQLPQCDRPVSEALIWKSQTSGRRKANRPRELRLVHRWRIWPEIRAQKMREDLYQTIKLPGNVGAEKLSGGEDLVWFDSIEAWNLWHLCPIYSTWAAIASF